MIKRIVSIILLVTMLMSFMVPGVYAAEDDGYIDNVVIENGNVPDELSNIVVVNQSETTNVPEETTVSVVAQTTEPAMEETTLPEVENEPVSLVPPCDCGNAGVEISVHGDGCAAKMFYRELCNRSAGEIYALWELLPTDGQQYIKLYLSWTNANTLNKLELLIAAGWTGTGDVAATSKDGNMVGAFGVPENASVQVNNASADAQAAVDGFVAEQNDDATALFTWDISVTDSNGASWQPDESVQVVLEIPGERLHKHTPVYVVHVDDEGNVEKLSAQVTQDGKISFYTNGFSTFAGFTVDFEYDGMPFSISGMSSILLSELMDQLKMPFDVANVADVTFTNYDLIAIEKQDGDWKLTSLVAFQTEEALTLTMNDGKVYEIKVTDPEVTAGTHIWHVYNGYFASGVNHIYSATLFPFGDNSAADTGYDAIFNKAYSYSGWNENVDSGPAKLYFDDYNQVTTVTLTPRKKDTQSYGKKLIMDMFTEIKISNGANVTIQLDEAAFNSSGIEEVIIRSADPSRPIFFIEDGTLTLKGTAKTKIVLDFGATNGTPKNTLYPHIWENSSDKSGSRSLNLEYVGFRNSAYGGVDLYNSRMTSVTLKNCTFESTVSNKSHGGAVRIRNGGADLTKFEANTCSFSGTTASGRGGAISIEKSNVTNISVDGCTFNGTTAQSHGGAICINGDGDKTVTTTKVDIKNCTFTNTKANGNRGGGIRAVVNTPEFLVTNCTFSGNSAGSNGGSIGLQGTIGTLSISGSGFKNCTAGYAGGIAVDCNTTSTTISDCDFENCTSGNLEPMCYRNSNNDYVDANGNVVVTKATMDSRSPSLLTDAERARTQITDAYGNQKWNGYGSGGAIVIYKKHGNVTIKGTSESDRSTFTNCKTLNSGGAICFDDSFETSGTVKMDYLHINGCVARDAGNAVYFGSCTIPTATLDHSLIENCTYSKSSFRSASYNGNDLSAFELSVMEPGTKMGDGKNAPQHNYSYAKMVFNTDDSSGTIRCIGDSRVVLTIQNSTFKKNESFSNGGAVYWNANRKLKKASENAADNTITPQLSLKNSIFQENIALRDGGAVYAEASIEFTGGEFYRNIAERGGAIAQQVYNNPSRKLQAGEKTEVKLSSTTKIYNNYARSCGGGVSILANTTSSIDNGTNLAFPITFQLNGAQVYNNLAAVNGGGIYFYQPSYNDQAEQDEVNAYVKNITIDNGSIHNNIAGYGKGTEAPATLITTLSGTINSANAAGSGNGGGVYLEASENCTLQITTGDIYSNTAKNGNGGGIYMTGKNAKCTITGGTIGGQNKANVASYFGGGIAISGGATIDMTVASGATTGGTISYNSATDGGGIWLDASAANALHNSITISKGNIANNYASNYGGGICLKDNATAELNGGNIYSNSGFLGGGFFAANSSSFVLTSGSIYSNTGRWQGAAGYVIQASASIEGGSVYSNTANDCGGAFYILSNSTTVPFTFTMRGGSIRNNTSNGWGGAIYANGYSNSKLTIYDGDIHDNTANTDSGRGGAISIEKGAVIEMHGGNIYKNTAGSFGGAIQVYNASSGTIWGGQIYENTAESGGGVAVVKNATLIITNAESSVARDVVAGKITNNTASRGGGVFVYNSGSLTVENGFVTYNTATGKPTVTTAYQDHANLKGTGGGIYVADGTSGIPSKFVLTGTDYAIYGNTAEFAADDVFANGNYTQLDVPLVKDMNLSGYEFKPRGWFEDYANEDTSYSLGLKMNPDFANGNANGTIAGNENERYKTAPGSKRYEIISSNGTKAGLPANMANTYVCMTLGYAGAVSDTIVVDYTLDVNIHVLANDPVMNQESSGAKIVAVGPVTTLEYQKTLPSNFTSGTNGIVLNNDFLGKIIISDNKLQYQLQSMVFSDAVQFSYAVLYGGEHYFGKVTIIPATTIYYEDYVRSYDTATGDTIATSNAIKYDTVSYYEGTSTPLTGTPDGWNHNYASGTTSGWFQAEDRPGTGNDNDADKNYGFDNSYMNCTNFSKGRAHKFTAKREKVTVSGQTKYKITYGTATFKFSGTGFDIISATSSDTGTITAQVKDSSGAVVKSLVVDTYYGYAYENNQWVVVKPNSSNALYQVPVIKCNGLPHGTYEVVITISYADFFDHNHDGSYDFYLDGIRVYDPANDGANNPTIKDAYVADEEGWPEYLELRNFLLKQKDFDSLDQSSSNAASGVIFIDGKGNIDGSNTKSVAIKDYHNFGPNNEIYLQPGQSIACNFTVPSTNNGAKVTSIQIGLKSVGGAACARVYGIKDSKSTYAVGTSSQYKTINTAMDLYYDITAINGSHIVITNDRNSPSILSITNVKITYDAPHTDYIEDLYYGDAYFKTTKAMASQTMESLNVLYGYVEAPASIDLVGATLSFEDEILTNLYYTTTSMDGVAGDSMGLLTWSQMPEEVAVDAAENVYAGAVYVAESGRYMVQTDGIAAKELGDDIYMAVYAQMEDGSFIYSDVISYSPKRYAMSRLENSDNENLKALCVAMLNYGAEAQKYFGYKADSLMNADLTDEQQALVADYDATLFTGAVAADPAKVGAFAATETGFSGKSASVSFEGAFALNFYFAPDREDAEITFCYWTKDAYESAEILNIDNASGTVVMTADGNGVYHGQITGVAAKQLDDTYYVAAIYTVDGETYCSGVIAYSLSTYCMKNANSGMGELAQATAMYGYYAKTYFG